MKKQVRAIKRLADFLCLYSPGEHTKKGILPAFARLVSISAIVFIFNTSSIYAETWIATAYCPCKKCCNKSDGITASNKQAKEGRTVAINWLKFGQKVALNGRIYIVEDRGAKSIFGSKNRHFKRIDIFFASHKKALRFGRQKVELVKL